MNFLPSNMISPSIIQIIMAFINDCGNVLFIRVFLLYEIYVVMFCFFHHELLIYIIIRCLRRRQRHGVLPKGISLILKHLPKKVSM